MKKRFTLLKILSLSLSLLIVTSCTRSTDHQKAGSEAPFLWENANIYFLLTDRFHNGDPSNDLNFDRMDETAVLRGFQGGDIAGVIQKLEEGYFKELGVTALWLTPWFEQVHGSTDEGTGVTYGYHGYWTSDWTSMDPNFGSEEEVARLIEIAHSQGIRIVMDVIINHTGPVTPLDPVWPDEWVRTEPACTYKSYESTQSCTLVENLPDIRTGSDQEVDLPPSLLEKWEKEGRLEEEMAELDAFFQETGYPRAPRYYIIKWLTDLVRKYGIDGYRLDTARHIEEGVWKELFGEASKALSEWRLEHPDKALDQNAFYMVGEVYGYGISSDRLFHFPDTAVDYFAEDIHSLINFDFKYNATGTYEELFSLYSDKLATTLKGKGVLNYLTSHDDGGPYDKDREKPMEAGTKLLLSPGSCQIYYGDESCRNLVFPEANGDATLRGPMNWDEIDQNLSRKGKVIGDVLKHYQKLGQFRKEHPSVGAGEHQMVSTQPYLFTRHYAREDYSDQVLVGLDMNKGEKTIRVDKLFAEGSKLYDYYSESAVRVEKGQVVIDSEYEIVLLGQR
ncbi:MAG: alpha-amylase family glycosyl hydrolase [Bacteroides sp.]|nr:alpha-amylase family glycosyl hydrolase [Bacteroides sp.]